MFTCMIDPTVEPPNVTHWFVKYHFESWVWLYDLLQLSSLESVVTIWWWSWWGYALLHLYLTSPPIWLRTQEHAVVETCQSQRSHTQKHAILFCLSPKTLLISSSMSCQRTFSWCFIHYSYLLSHTDIFIREYGSIKENKGNCKRYHSFTITTNVTNRCGQITSL